MKFLECPVCQKQAAKAWQLFIAVFWISRSCINCQAKLRLDFKTFSWIACFVIAGVAVGNLLTKVFSIENDLLPIVVLVLFILIPIFMGKRLFEERKPKKVDDDA